MTNNTSLYDRLNVIETITFFAELNQIPKDIYKERTGFDYKPRVKKADPEAVKNTATAKEVDELLATIFQKKVA